MKMRMNELENNYNAAELSVDVRDVRLEHALDVMLYALKFPHHPIYVIRDFIELHPTFDNPVLDEKAARLRELVE